MKQKQKRQNYKNRQLSFKDFETRCIFKNVEDIRNKSISSEKLNDIREDFEKHISTWGGTAHNYCGKYGQPVINAVIDNYPDVINAEEVDVYAKQKEQALLSHMYYLAINNMKINVQPGMLKLIIDSLKGQEIQQTQTIINNNFFQTQDGNIIHPQEKSIP